MVPVLDSRFKEQFEKVSNLVSSEVNVKEVEFVYDTTGLITKKIKPNFKTLGKKYGKQMKDIAAAFAQMRQQQISDIEKSEVYTLSLASGDVVLEKEDYSISSEDMPGWLVASDSDLTVALDITVTDQLRREGIARELINRIQNLRKDSGFEVTDRIRLTVEDLEEVRDALQDYRQYVCEQTLAVSLDFGKDFGGARVEWDEGTIELLAVKA
jgi:isoleucyl-tRNA synthetase